MIEENSLIISRRLLMFCLFPLCRILIQVDVVFWYIPQIIRDELNHSNVPFNYYVVKELCSIATDHFV